jgi:hypothetical protein
MAVINISNNKKPKKKSFKISVPKTPNLKIKLSRYPKIRGFKSK